MIRKFISEFVGTLLLVFFGCGTAVAINQYVVSLYGISMPWSIIFIALAFGLVLMALVYCIGKVSGCHVNPAVSVANLIDGRISIFECVYYVCAQILGGICGALILSWIFGSTANLGANGFETLSTLSTLTTLPVAITMEAILTFIFVLVVLSATKKENDNVGLPIGLTLTLVHIIGIPFTGTSVNPARSIGPAFLTGGLALEQLWVFIVAPLIGGIVAALFYKFVINTPEIETAKNYTEKKEISSEEDVKENKSVKQTTKKGK